MATYLDLIKKLMKPEGIHLVGRPSCMPELVIAFRKDLVVQHLLKAGRRAAPLICRELRRGGAAVPPLARACLFWVLCQTAPDMAAHLVKPPLAGRADDSAVLLAALGPEWMSRGLVLGAQTTGTQLASSGGPGILASILSVEPYPSQIDFYNYAIPGITNSRHKPANFYWSVPPEKDGRSSANWCTVRWLQNPADLFEGCGRPAVGDSPARYVFFGGRTCEYIHLDGSREWLRPTSTYSCAGLIWLPRRIVPGEGLGDLIADCDYIADDDAHPGDIVAYQLKKPDGTWDTKHWGVVWKVAPWGVKKLYPVEHLFGIGTLPEVREFAYWSRVLEVRSKLSSAFQEAIHSPYDQALFYYYAGQFHPDNFKLRLLRRNRFLRGNVIDLWIKTHRYDNGEMYSQDAFWESPDIKIAEGPFPVRERVRDQDWYGQANCIGEGGRPDELTYGKTYRIWAKVRNRGDRDLDGTQPPNGYPWDWEQDEPKHWFGNAYIRYYCAFSGCPQREDWHLVSFPLGPFTVPRRAGFRDTSGGLPFTRLPVNAPFAEWTPLAVLDPGTGPSPVRSHLCFLAIVYSICSCPGHEGNPPGDDPKNRCNADPIVYPWEPAWDNNIAMKNVSIVNPGPGEVITLPRLLGIPHDLETIEGALETVISHRFDTARQGLTEDPAPLEVFLRMGGDSEITTSMNEYKEKGILFLPNDNKGLEKRMGGVVLPYKLPGGKRTQFFDVKIRVPKKAKPGSVYYVRIAQNLHGRIVSGCTIVVRIV